MEFAPANHFTFEFPPESPFLVMPKKVEKVVTFSFWVLWATECLGHGPFVLRREGTSRIPQVRLVSKCSGPCGAFCWGGVLEPSYLEKSE